jgi:hypothetical protein
MAGCPLPGSTVVLSGSGHPAIAVCGPSRRGRRRHLTPQRRTESQVCKTDAYVARANFYRAKARAVDAAATRAATAATRSPPPPLAGGHCGHTAADAADHGGTLECDIPKPPEKRQRIAKNAKLENAIFQLTSEIDHADAKSALLRVELKHVEVKLFGQLQETTKTEMKKRELKNDILMLTSQIDHASKEISKLEATRKRALLTEDLESELWA